MLEESYRFDDETMLRVSLMDTAAALFNDWLTLVEELNVNYTEATFTYSSEAFILNMTCSKVRLDEGMCLPDSDPCSNRTNFTFFDGFHHAEIPKIEAAKVAYYTNSSVNACFPYNISYLAVLDSDAARIPIVGPIIEDGKEKNAGA